MQLDALSIIASLIVSSIGVVSFIYGKRQSRLVHMAFGAVLVAFPYFISNGWLVFAIGALIIGLQVMAVRFGL